MYETHRLSGELAEIASHLYDGNTGDDDKTRVDELAQELYGNVERKPYVALPLVPQSSTSELIGGKEHQSFVADLYGNQS